MHVSWAMHITIFLTLLSQVMLDAYSAFVSVPYFKLSTHARVPLQALLALASGGMEACALGRANWASFSYVKMCPPMQGSICRHCWPLRAAA